MADDIYPMTPQGLARLRIELKRIREVDRPANVLEIEEALEHGDLRENAEYHAAKDKQAELDARMRFTEYRIGLARVIDPAQIKSSKVGFGATVKLNDLDTEAELVYRLVGEHEADIDQGKISIKSPIARAMIGKAAGDDLVLKLPKGDRELEVLEVEYKAID